MAWLNAEQHAIVSAAVREAELGTSGEIVPVIADRSDGYSDVVLVWAVAASFTAMSLCALFPMSCWPGSTGCAAAGAWNTPSAK